MPRKAQTESVSDLNAAPGGAAAVDRALSLLSAFRPGDEALSLAPESAEARGLRGQIVTARADGERAKEQALEARRRESVARTGRRLSHAARRSRQRPAALGACAP